MVYNYTKLEKNVHKYAKPLRFQAIVLITLGLLNLGVYIAGSKMVHPYFDGMLCGIFFGGGLFSLSAYFHLKRTFAQLME